MPQVETVPVLKNKNGMITTLVYIAESEKMENQQTPANGSSENVVLTYHFTDIWIFIVSHDQRGYK